MRLGTCKGGMTVVMCKLTNAIEERGVLITQG
jgi:hypothetical protein